MPKDQLDLLDPAALADEAERRITLAELAEAVMGETDRANTIRAFASDWDRWTRFCESVTAQGLPTDPLSASPDALVVFARWLAGGGLLADGTHVRPHAPESIRRRLTGVLYGWRQHGVEYPRGITENARNWVSDYQAKLIERKRPTGRGPASVLEIEDAHRIAETTPPTLAGRRDLALVFLGFAIGARSSELSFLDVSDIEPAERGVYVNVRRSKTKPRRPAVIYGQYAGTCPVLSWRRWQEASGIITGPAFRQIDRHGNLGGRLSPVACSEIVKRAGRRVRKDLKLTGHSVRAGFATAAIRAKKDPRDVAAQAGWTEGSAAMRRYIRQVRVWDENVLAGIGL